MEESDEERSGERETLEKTKIYHGIAGNSPNESRL